MFDVFADECPSVYAAFSAEKMEDVALPITDVSIFALLVDPKPYISKTISTAGMLVTGHGRSYLVPVASINYAFTKDAIQIDDRKLPKCMLEKLNGLPVDVVGVLNGPIDDVNTIVRPVFLLGALPMTASDLTGDGSLSDDNTDTE